MAPVADQAPTSILSLISFLHLLGNLFDSLAFAATEQVLSTSLEPPFVQTIAETQTFNTASIRHVFLEMCIIETIDVITLPSAAPRACQQLQPLTWKGDVFEVYDGINTVLGLPSVQHYHFSLLLYRLCVNISRDKFQR